MLGARGTRHLIWGHDQEQCFRKMCEVLGPPTAEERQQICGGRPEVLERFKRVAEEYEGNQILKRQQLEARCGASDAAPSAVDLVCRLLEYDPDRRLSAKEAISSHPFFGERMAKMSEEERRIVHEPVPCFDDPQEAWIVECFHAKLAVEPAGPFVKPGPLIWEQVRSFHPGNDSWTEAKGKLPKAALGRTSGPSVMST